VPEEVLFGILALFLLYCGFDIRKSCNTINEKVARDKQELEAKYAAQCAELLEQFNKHQG
jgi:hypothetical protein